MRARGGHLDQAGGRREPGAELRRQPLQHEHDPRRTEVVHHSEGAAAEGRKADPEDGADVAVAGANG